MCGIIAIVRRRTTRRPPEVGGLAARLESVAEGLPSGLTDDLADRLDRAARDVADVDRELRGEAGLAALVGSPSFVAGAATTLTRMAERIEAIEATLEERGDSVPALETVNGALIGLKDAVWAVERDRLRAAREVIELAGAPDGESADREQLPGGGAHLPGGSLAALFSIQQALSNLDRLEVRGRDSAGIHILVRDHGLDLSGGEAADLLADRTTDPLFVDRSVRVVDGHLGFVYKAAAEIGELGDNTSAMREAIAADRLLHRALAAPGAEATVLAHTRWASVGIISQPNAHPVNSEEVGPADRGPYVTAALNGDVDNFADLIAADGLAIAPEITTDAKVIPTLVSRGLASGLDLDEAVRSSVAQFEGSVAIGISSAAHPADVHLALRGSGQGVYVGLAEGLLRRGLGALRRGRGLRRLPPDGRRDPGRPGQPDGQPGPDHPPPGRPGRPGRRGEPDVLRRHGVADRRGRVEAADGHHPGHRPGRRPSLPAQGDQRVAGLVPQDPAGSPGRPGR